MKDEAGQKAEQVVDQWHAAPASYGKTRELKDMIAAALREAQMNDSALHMERLRTNSLCKQRDELHDKIDELRAKLAEADILVQRQVEDVTRRLFDDIETLKAERDAGFVRGLERAKEMFRDQHVVTVTDFIEMIDAEIDKATR